MDIAQLLNGVGLGQYEALFREHEIDADVLVDLTEADLEKIGVPLGHRKRLMRAIAILPREAGEGDHAQHGGGGMPPFDPSPPTTALRAVPLPRRAGEEFAERRPITVMFCDLAGSTGLAARMDAEDWRNLVGGYLDEAAAAVTGLGGHVLKKLGDGLMALFGYPQAQENDAERAVRAALAIQRALAGLNARNARLGAPELAARIGLESGSVVVDAAGEVFGEAPNVAARVQSAAEPGTVLVTANVLRQTAGLFVAEDKGPQALRGVPQPVALYRIVRASGGGRRGGSRFLTPLVGREDELALLMRRWERALQGEGQFVQIVGEPGLGKSRLIEEFRAKLTETPHTWVEWAASQLLQNTPLHPIAEWGRQRFGGPDIPGEQRFADLESTLALVGLDASEAAPLLAPLFDIPAPGLVTLAPEEFRRRQLAAMVAWYLAGARTQSVALAIEDLHWADPTSLDLLRALVERGGQAPLMILATARPEFRAPWTMRSHHSVIALAPLDRAQVRRMVGEIAASHALSADVVEGVGERTGGVPLFVEEVTRLLVERGAAGGVQTIPPTLQQSLAARLDRLGEAREVAQIGAVLGREFSYSLLHAVAGFEADRVQTALDRLADSDLMIVEGAPPSGSYRFKHALIRDAAYDSLLKSRRQALHRRAADALLATDAEPEAIAHHFTEAGLDDAAIEWWGKAGDQALRRSAFQEAIAHLGKAIAMADKGAGAASRRGHEDVADPGQRMKLQSDYSQAMMWSKGFAAQETRVAIARAAELAERTDDFLEHFAALQGQWGAAITGGELRSARELAQTLLREAEDAGRVTEAGTANWMLGLVDFFHGDFVEARTHCERALDARDPNPDPKVRERIGDVRNYASSHLAATMWQLGEVDRARELIDWATRRAPKTDIPTIVDALFFRSYLELWRGDPVATLNAAEALEPLARENGIMQYVNEAELHLGWARGRLDDPTTGAAEVRRVLAAFVDQGVRVNLGFYNGLLAQLEAETLGAESALARIDEAFALSNQVEHRCSLPFLHRLRGQILLKRDSADPAPAEEALRTSIALAKEQGARSPRLQAALALAKLCQSTGRPVDARAVLAPALEGFAPTLEMPEIAEAQALLAALAETVEVKAEAAQRERRAQLELNMATALLQGRGMQAPETRAAFERAGDIAAAAADPMEALAVLYGRWAGELARGDVRRMMEIGVSIERVAAREPSGQGALVGRRVVGLTQFFAGDLMGADHNMRWAADHYDFDRDHVLAIRFAHDQGAAAQYFLAFANWLLGDADAAWSLIAEAKTLAELVRHPPTSVAAYTIAAWLDCVRGDHVHARANAETSVALARDFDLPLWRSNAEFLLAWARAGSGGTRAAWDEAETALAAVLKHGTGLAEPSAAYVAEGHAGVGNFERALALVDRALTGPVDRGLRVFLPEAHRVRGEILLKRDPADPAPAEEAFRTAIAVAREQSSRTFGLRAALALARLYQSTGRPAEAHAVLAPALEGFAATPEMPEIAEAQSLLTALEGTEEVRGEAARHPRQRRLHAAYGNALFAARGYAAPETTEAFARARESAYGDKDAPERLAADWGLWAGSYTRGELPSMRTHAVAFLSDVEARPDSPEAGVAHRVAGITCWSAGEYAQARDHFERALALFQPGRDDDLAFRFGHDPGVAAMAYLAFASWPLGEVDRAISLIDRTQLRIADLTHVATLARGRMLAALFELMRGDRARAAPNAFELARLAREHDLPMWGVFGVFLEGWATAASGAVDRGLEDMRHSVGLLREQNVLIFDGLLKIALAGAEARAGDRDRAVAILDEALATSERIGHRAFEAELHRARGEILLQRDPANPAPAEEAFQTAIAVAKRQGTRSFELRAALALAKLYQSTGRPADAHAVLAPALDGFSPTPEMPESAEAEALLAALAETVEVKAEAAQRGRLSQLRVAYGNALIATRGFGAPETTEAFARARESASGDKGAPERLATDFGLWAGSYTRGELPSMRAQAAAFLSDVAARPDSPEAGVAHRAAGNTCWFAGEYREARNHLERALALFQPGRDDDLAFRFGADSGVAAMAWLAIASWPIGEVERSVSLIDSMQTRVAGLTHVGTLAVGRAAAAMFELTRRDTVRAAPHALELARLAREHDLPMFRGLGVFLEGWATAAIGAPGDGLKDMRRGVDLLREVNYVLFDGLLKIALAEGEARAGDPSRAVAILDEALATCDRTGHRAFEAELHRARGEMLLQRDPAKPAPATEALLTAIAVAKRQGARSFELRAAHSLAKLYQSTGRPADAHAVLAPALEGFPPTPEMPEIAEAEALLAALKETDEVRTDTEQRRRLTQLHVAYGNALVAARGYGATETTEAFAKAGQLASDEKDAPERLAADWGLWAGSYVRGDLPSMRAHAAAFLRDVEARPDSPEAGVAHRAAGETYWVAGEYREARDHLESALALFQPGRDDDLAFRFGVDPGVNAIAYLAIASWALGEVDRAISLIDRMQARIGALTHVGTLALGRMHAAMFELMRGEHACAAQNAFELVRLTREYDLNMWGAFGVFLRGWAASHTGAPTDGLEDMRHGAELLREQNVLMFDGLLKIVQAEAEARAGDPDRAVSILDEALATVDRTSHRAFEAELHRARGEMLLKREPANPAPAEEAFQTALVVARRQSTRSFELRAALSLAKHYQSTGRPADAHAVLARALEGFPALSLLPFGRRAGDEGVRAREEGSVALTPDPSPERERGSPHFEMPEIAEALTLLAALAESDEIKAAEAQRQQRLRLQTAYGHAMMMARGFAAEETKAAFARARALSAKTDDFAERFAACHGQWTLALVRGEQRRARELALPFLKEAEEAGRVMEACIVHRSLALICLFSANFLEARTHCERALDACDPERDRETRERFTDDTGTLAMSCLAVTSWELGEPERARGLIDSASRRARELRHAPSMAHPLIWRSHLELLRGDAAAALSAAEALEALGREHGMASWRVRGELNLGWARGRLHDAATGAEDLRRALALSADRVGGGFGDTWFYTVLLAELEAETLGADIALAHIDEALALADRGEYRCDLAFPHRLRGEILLERDPSNPAPAEEAFRTALAIAKQQGARSWSLRAALSLARLYQSTGRPAEAQGVLAPALEGFAPTPQMPEIAEALALLAAVGETDEVKSAATRRQRLTRLHVSYASALFTARGYGAPETTGAFARARESASADRDAPGRFEADYGLWVGSYVRGELPLMRVHTAAFLSDIEGTPDSPEAGIAYRTCGVTHQFAGEYAEARENLERALALFQPGRDDDLAFRFGLDVGFTVLICSAIALWPLGEVERALSLAESAQARLAAITHAGSLAFGRQHLTLFELMRRDRVRGAEHAFELARLAREHDLTMFRAFAAFFEGWAKAAGGAPEGGLEDMRRGVDLLREQNVLQFDGLLKITLAEAEARAGDPDRAVAILDEALAAADHLGYRAFEAELHRARGEMLLKRDPVNPAPAQDALLSAVAVAKRQGTRSFGLRAALALAKLYQSTGRPTDAYGVLGPALEGFAPTAEMLEVAEAEALLAFLAETEEVKSDTARRRRDAQLRVAYGNALIPARGYGAPETEAALAAAREQANGDSAASERLAADYGLWANSYTRADLPSMQAYASTFLDDVRTRPESPEAGVARRAAGLTCWFAGKYREARDHFERALSLFEPGRDDDLAFRFGPDPGVAAMIDLAIASWPLGEVDYALSLTDRMQTRRSHLTNVGTIAFARMHAAVFELMRGDKARAAPHALELSRLGREHTLAMYSAFGLFFEGWVTAANGPIGSGIENMRRGIALLGEQDALLYDGLLKIALAEADAHAGDPRRAIAILDQALATADRTGCRAFEAELHRARGEMLLERNPDDRKPAEQALLTAIEIAREQGTRSFGLRAALALAKLYQSTGRSDEAHAVLAPALEGFSPTSEMLEIAEAEALLAFLAETEEVKKAILQRQRQLDLQTAYGHALSWGKGFAAEETMAAFARVGAFAGSAEEASARFVAYDALCIGNAVRGELTLALELAETFLREAEAEGRAMEAGVARRLMGLFLLNQGDLKAARSHLERALADYLPARDGQTQVRFGRDTEVVAAGTLALVEWHLGEVDRARQSIDRALRRADELGRVPPATALFWKVTLEGRRGDAAATLEAADALLALSEKHSIPSYVDFGRIYLNWAHGRLGDPEASAADLRRNLDEFVAKGNKTSAPHFNGLLAELEVAAERPDRALTLIGHGLAIAEETGEHLFDPYLHNLRGEVLLRCDPADPVGAEEAFKAAIAIAKRQGARSRELLASLALAKFYQATGRPAEAHAVLAPALDGFAPTPEMPEIAEAQAMLAAL